MYERQYENGSDPQVLDLVRVPLTEPRPKTFQSENWLLDPDQYWVLDGRLKTQELPPVCDHPDTLWQNGYSTSNGLNDDVPEDIADAFNISLYLLPARTVVLQVLVTGGGQWPAKRRVQAQFTYNNIQHWLWVTDPEIEREFFARPDGVYPIGEVYMTISLGERFKGHCYKLVATIIRTET